MPFLTPENEPGASVCYRILAPGGDEWAALLRGALLELCIEGNWQEYGSETPAATAAAWQAALLPFGMDECDSEAGVMAAGDFRYTLPTGTTGPSVPTGDNLVPFNGWYGDSFAEVDSGYTIVAPGTYLSFVSLSLSFADTYCRITIRNGNSNTLAQSINARSYGANVLTMASVLELGEYTQPGLPDNCRQVSVFNVAAAIWGPAINHGIYPEMYARWQLLRLGD